MNAPDLAPAISVLMAVRDGASYLNAAIQSILEQDFADFEIVVVDDGSTDATPALLAELAARDHRLRLLRQPALGLVAALNSGLAAARAPLIARMDADDVARIDRLRVQREFLEANPDIVLVGSAMEVINARGRTLRLVNLPTQPSEIYNLLPAQNCLAHPTVMFRRMAVLALGGYRAQFPQAEDYDLWLQLSERYPMAALELPLVQYREHRGQISWRGHEQRIMSELAAAAAAEARRKKQPDPAAGIERADRSLLSRCGWSDARIALATASRAINTARAARQAGFKEVARASAFLALRQPSLRLRSRLRCGVEWLRSCG